VHVKRYLVSLPERMLRSAAGLGAGAVREASELVLPVGIRRTRLYSNIVDAMLRFLVEQVGRVDGVYPSEEALAGDFLLRRTAGNALEAVGIVAFRVSPVWVLAALADVCGAGRQLIPEIGDALAAEGLIDKNTQFSSVEQILDGLERTSSRLAATINLPPFDVATLRQEWQAIRGELRAIPSASLPRAEALRDVWGQIKAESTRQRRSILEISTALALSAAAKFPDGLRWVSASSRVAASRAAQMVAVSLLEHYRHTLADIRRVGYVRYAYRQYRPYVRAAIRQFAPTADTLTERLLSRRLRVVDIIGVAGRAGLVGRGLGGLKDLLNRRPWSDRSS
jgi:hypothetical protein